MPTLRLPNNMTKATPTNKNVARPIITLRKPKGRSRTKITGPTVARPLPSPSTPPVAIDLIRVGKFSAVYVKRQASSHEFAAKPMKPAMNSAK